MSEDLIRIPKAQAEVGQLPGHPFLHATQQRQVMFQTTFEDFPTNVVVTSFSDTIMVNVTQTNKMGAILSACRVLPADVTGQSQGTFQVQTLLGRRDDIMYSALARRLVKVISDAVEKKLLLSIALHPTLTKKIAQQSKLEEDDPSSRFGAYTKLVQEIIDQGLNVIAADG